MSQSYIEYNQGLSETTFDVPFKYISINDVKALGFDGSRYTSLTISERNASEDTVTLAVAPSAYTSIRLYRSTSTTQLVDFQNGSRLSEADLDTAYQQGLFAAQEIAEDASTSQFTAVSAAAIQSGTSLSNFSSMEIASDGTDGLIDGVNAVYDISSLSPQTSRSEAYRVSIDGVMQSPVSAYSITITPAEITFSEAPPASAKIVVVSAASAASAVSVDDVTIGLTSGNQAEIKDGSVNNDKLAGGITQDKLAGLSITNSELAGGIATSKLAEVIDDDTMTTGVSATSLASSSSIKAYADSSPKSQMKVDGILGASMGANTESVTFANGLIIKFGQKTINANGDYIIFETPFPNACISVQGTCKRADSNNNMGLASFSATRIDCNPNTTDAYTWLAIGY